MVFFHVLFVSIIASVFAENVLLKNESYSEEARIVGGHDASDHKYKYLVSFQEFENRHFCAGSIIDENWILTAAHCVAGRDPESYIISVGSNYLDFPGKKYKPRFHVFHREYKEYHFKDIALVRVLEKIIFDDYVQSISIAENQLPNEEFFASFAGWGSKTLGGPISNSLQEIDLKIVSNDECKKQISNIDETHVCTYNKMFEGVCHADSGGPLVLNDHQIGIASYVTPCALGFPDVFTRVYSYREWIKENIKKFA